MKTKVVNKSRLDPSCLPRVAIIVGSIHILQSLWNTIEAAIDLIQPDQEFPEAIFYNSMITFTFAFIFALVGALLIIGAWKRSHLLLLPWLVLEGFSLVIYFVFIATNLADTPLTTWSNFALLMINFSLIALCSYVWYAILIFYKNIRNEKRKSIQDDEETLYADSHQNEVFNEKSYPPPYIIPVEFFNSKEPPSPIKY